MLNFSIPPASYDLDLRLDKFHKALYKETAFERVDIYGAYINLKIYDAELETVYWDQAVKFGATKQTVNGQLTDDFATITKCCCRPSAQSLQTPSATIKS